MSGKRWVRVDEEKEGIALLTLDRPPVNALNRELVEDLGRAAARLAENPRIRCLVMRSGGRHFCAGADLAERRKMTVEEVREFVSWMSRAMDAIARLPFPTIAAVRGTAAGAGCELALACDIRILAEDVAIGLRETALGVIPVAGGTQRLPRLIGPARAKRWIFTARAHTAEEALADGVADKVVAAARLDAEARRMAEAIAANGPVAVRLAKRAVDGGLDRPLSEALDLERICYEGVLGTQDRVEALRAFAEKRPPRFRGD